MKQALTKPRAGREERSGSVIIYFSLEMELGFTLSLKWSFPSLTHQSSSDWVGSLRVWWGVEVWMGWAGIQDEEGPEREWESFKSYAVWSCKSSWLVTGFITVLQRCRQPGKLTNKCWTCLVSSGFKHSDAALCPIRRLKLKRPNSDEAAEQWEWAPRHNWPAAGWLKDFAAIFLDVREEFDS